MRPVKDILLWAALAGPVTLSWTVHRAYPIGLLVAGLALWAGAVALSRRLPLASLFAVVALCALDGNYSFGLPPISYLAGLRMATIRPAAAGFTGIALLGTPLVGRTEGFVTWATLAGALVYAGVFPWLVGRYRRQQKELLAAGWEHAEQLERAQRMLATEVRLRERTRIAEDMHDSLGHELSLLALRAGALELAGGLDDRHRAVARQLRAGAATATDRLREIVDVLRDGPADPAPTRPAAESIAELVRRAGDSGLAVRLHSDGAPGPLPPMVDRAAYRVVQESLTNATKHAPGAAVTVRLRQTDAETVLSITNARPPAPGTPGQRGGGGGGRGLAGLRERVRLAGGALHAGDRDGGFEVVARLPHGIGTGPEPLPAGDHDGAPTIATRPTPGPDADARVLVRPGHGAALTGGSAQRARYRRGLVQREARRRLVAATAVLAALAVALGGTAAGYYLYATSGSVLTPGAYTALRVDQDRAAVERVLPRREMLQPPDVDPLPTPPGAGCRYYRSHGDVLRSRLDVYRLCFADGRLVAKDVLWDS